MICVFSSCVFGAPLFGDVIAIPSCCLVCRGWGAGVERDLSNRLKLVALQFEDLGDVATVALRLKTDLDHLTLCCVSSETNCQTDFAKDVLNLYL